MRNVVKMINKPNQIKTMKRVFVTQQLGALNRNIQQRQCTKDWP